MVVSLHTGPVGREELQAIILIVDEGESTADSSIFSAPQDSIITEHLHQEEYKVSA